MSKPTGKMLRLLTAGVFYAFFLFGFADNLKGPVVPALLEDLHFSYSQGGTILLAAYVGFLLATLLTGFLADVAGLKAMMYVAGIALSVGAAAYSASGSFWLLVGSMAVLGFGLGSIELGANAIIVDLHGERKGLYLNLLAMFHGLGSMVAPLYAGRLLAADVSWRQVYQFSVALVVVMPLYFLFLRYPRRAPEASAEPSPNGLWRTAFGGSMGWFYLLISAYVAAEIGLASWVVEFLQTVKDQPVVLSSSFLSMFFGGIMVGRLLGSLVVERVGYLRLMLVASLASVVCVALGTFGPRELAFCLPLAGLFFSIIFPTTTAAVSDLHKERQGAILGLLFTFGGAGGMVGPWLMGVCSDLLGIRLGFGVLLGFCLLVTLALAVLIVQTRHKTSEVSETSEVF